MESFLSRYRNPLVLLAIVLAQMIGLAVQVRRPVPGSDGRQTRLIRYWVVGLISPFERIFLLTGHGISGVWNDYIDLRHVRSQNRRLQAELDRMRLEEATLAEDARQGIRLQKLLGFQQQYISKTVAAHVIGTSGTDQSRVLYIDKGAADGIRADLPVITPDGVVGKVRDVFAHSAQVLEINDQTSGLGVILAQSRLRGILRGTTAGQTEIIDILPDEHIRPGETVITSGGDQIYPRGLPVGVVDRVVPDPAHNPYVAVLVRPNVNLSRLDEVLVVTHLDSSMPAAMAEDVTTSEQKAADILAQRLPGATPPPATGPNGQPIDANAPPPPVQPPLPLHPDRFTPGAAPDATSLTPGAPYPKQVFAPPPAAASTASAPPAAERQTATPRASAKPPHSSSHSSDSSLSSSSSSSGSSSSVTSRPSSSASAQPSATTRPRKARSTGTVRGAPGSGNSAPTPAAPPPNGGPQP